MITITLEGVRPALKGLKRFTGAARRTVMRKALRAGGKVILQLAKKFVPKRSKTLFKSMAVKVKYYKKREAAVAMIGPRTWFYGEWRGRKLIAHKYAQLVEQGTRWARAAHFIRKAVVGGRNMVLRAIRDAIAAEWTR